MKNNPVPRNPILLLFLLFSPLFSPAQNENGHAKSPCHPEKIRWNLRDQEFKDTLVQFRNWENNRDDRRVLCQDHPAGKNLEKIVWECPYIKTHLRYMERMGKFAFLSCRAAGGKFTVISFYLCSRKSKESVECFRFKLEGGRITGINTLPCCQDIFIPIEEYDKPEGPIGM